MEAEGNSSSSSSTVANKKLMNMNNEDRISGLHEPLIQHILSFMDMKKVLQTSLLSKRWTNLWLAISGPKLKYLQLENIFQGINYKTSIKIYAAPSLASLKCIGYTYKDYTLENLSALVTAEIDTYMYYGDKDAYDMATLSISVGRYLSSILKGITNAKSLTLSGHGFQAFEELPNMLEGVPVSVQSLKYLKLTKWCDKSYIYSLAKLLKVFPLLETLVLERTELFLDCSLFHSQAFEELPNMLEGVPVSIQSLKYLKLTEWCDKSYIYSLAKLLEVFPLLETLVLERTKVLIDYYIIFQRERSVQFAKLAKPILLNTRDQEIHPQLHSMLAEILKDSSIQQNPHTSSEQCDLTATDPGLVSTYTSFDSGSDMDGEAEDDSDDDAPIGHTLATYLDRKSIRAHYGGIWVGKKMRGMKVWVYNGGKVVDSPEMQLNEMTRAKLFNWIREVIECPSDENVIVCWLVRGMKITLETDNAVIEFFANSAPHEDGLIHIYVDFVQDLTETVLPRIQPTSQD
ncbi:hypothetical protein IFM89_000461, partial [Coptis chinensis]